MRIVIIGGVASGMSAAFKAKRENAEAEITVLEREDYISFGACGLPYYMGDVFEDMDQSLFSRRLEDAKAQDIHLLQRHEVTAVDFDKKTVTATDLNRGEKKYFDYDKLMIATGATAITPDIKGIESSNVYTLTKPYIAETLKQDLKNYKNIAIIGGGFIGVEAAEQLSKDQNLNIHLYHSRDQLLNKVYDREAGEVIHQELQSLGVQVHFQERLKDLVTEEGMVKEIITTHRKDSVDAVILAIGFQPNTKIFTDERLKKLKNGAIVVDQYGRTSIQDVWSAGDCATVPHKFLGDIYLPLATSANKMGREIGINLVAEPENLAGTYQSLGSSVVQVGQREFGTTGLTEDQAQALGYDYAIASSKVRSKPNYMPDSQIINFRIIYEKETYKILGARVYGKQDAVLRMMPFTTAIHADLTTKELAYHDFPYSPPFALVWEAVNTAASVAK